MDSTKPTSRKLGEHFMTIDSDARSRALPAPVPDSGDRPTRDREDGPAATGRDAKYRRLLAELPNLAEALKCLPEESQANAHHTLTSLLISLLLDEPECSCKNRVKSS